MKTSLFLGTALTALLVTGMASAATHTYATEVNGMEGAKEKPDAVNSALTGSARFTYDDVALTLCGHITLSATNDVQAAHIHTGGPDVAGPVNIDFGVSPTTTKEIIVNQKITKAQGDSLTGDNYVNVHTTAHSGGEIRDQLLADDNGDPDEECVTEAADAGADSGTSSSSSTSSSGSTTTTPSDAGKTSSSSSGTSGTADSTDSGGCNTSGSSAPTYGALLGLGLVVAAVSRKRKKA